jgi:hypothetical protein
LFPQGTPADPQSCTRKRETGWSVGTSTPGAWPPPAGPDAAPGHRRLAVVLTSLGVLAVLSAVAWSILSPGDYTISHDGCVAITVASSTGAALLHQCGPKARTLCREARAGTDPFAARTRQECVLAGIQTPTSATG